MKTRMSYFEVVVIATHKEDCVTLCENEDVLLLSNIIQTGRKTPKFEFSVGLFYGSTLQKLKECPQIKIKSVRVRGILDVYWLQTLIQISEMNKQGEFGFSVSSEEDTNNDSESTECTPTTEGE